MVPIANITSNNCIAYALQTVSWNAKNRFKLERTSMSNNKDPKNAQKSKYKYLKIEKKQLIMVFNIKYLC